MSQKHKYSRKRQALLELLRSTKVHPSAEWLYTQLKPDYPDLSLGTVYRNLALFKEEGTINSVGTVQGQERFDGDTSPHAHFICTHCSRILDLDLPQAEQKRLRALAGSGGFQVQGYQVTFSGLCDECTGEKAM